MKGGTLTPGEDYLSTLHVLEQERWARELVARLGNSFENFGLIREAEGQIACVLLHSPNSTLKPGAGNSIQGWALGTES